MALFFNTQMKTNKGQAAVELAIFGSLILLALGVFVRYGLSANCSQKITMDAHQKARAEMGGNAESTTYIVLRDKPMPNPSDPFGIASRGSVFFASESVGRLSGVFDTPSYPSDSELLTDSQLPRIIYDINETTYEFTTAGFKYHLYNNQELKRKAYKDGGWFWKTSGPPRTDENGIDYEHDDGMETDGSFWENLVKGESQGKRADIDGDDKEELVIGVDLEYTGSHQETTEGYQDVCVDGHYEETEGDYKEIYEISDVSEMGSQNLKVKEYEFKMVSKEYGEVCEQDDPGASFSRVYVRNCEGFSTEECAIGEDGSYRQEYVKNRSTRFVSVQTYICDENGNWEWVKSCGNEYVPGETVWVGEVCNVEWVVETVTVEDYATAAFYVLDYQEGQIDGGYEGPNDQRQGLQSSSTGNLELIDCSIQREEDSNNIKSTTKTNWKQDVTRHIIVNPNYIDAAGLSAGDNIAGLALVSRDIDGDGQADWHVDIKSDFSGNKNLQWSTSHAN